jgi:alkylation response protein AidB-like acyl-CoA dehydrogenase
MFEFTPEQRQLQERAREVARHLGPRAAETDRTEAYPWYAVDLLKEARFMGMTIPEQYGGAGRSLLDAILVVEEIAKACGASGRIAVEANMGAIGAIMHYGTEEQKQLAARLVLSGDKPAICITEPDAGSDARAMTTRAERKGKHFVINGKKHWITGGGISRLHLIFARVFEDGVEQGIAGFIAVRGEAEGLIIGKREPAMGIRGIPEAEIRFENLEVPDSMMLVPPGGIGRGFAGLMNAYNGQRVGAATVALGIAEGAFDLAVDYAKHRQQFGRPIAEFQGLQWMLADMSVRLAAAQALIYKAAASAGAGFPDMVLTAQAKILAAETAISVTNDALQLFGSAGYSRQRPLERMVRDARMFTISGGTTQVLRNLVARKILNLKTSQTRPGDEGQKSGETA